MSLKEWKEKYYPVAAEEIAKNKSTGPIELIEHSLQKWRGLDDLDQYGITIGCFGLLYKGQDFEINSETCSLCQKYFKLPVLMMERASSCGNCPIVLASGRPCWGYKGSGWDTWVDYNDNQPMIKLLEQTLEFYKEKNRERQAKKLSRKSRA